MASAKKPENQDLYEQIRIHILRDMNREQKTHHTIMSRGFRQLNLVSKLQRLAEDESRPQEYGWQTRRDEPRRKRAFRYIRSAIRLLILLIVDLD